MPAISARRRTGLRLLASAVAAALLPIFSCCNCNAFVTPPPPTTTTPRLFAPVTSSRRGVLPSSLLFSSPSSSSSPLMSSSSISSSSGDGPVEDLSSSTILLNNNWDKVTSEWELDCYSRPVLVDGKKKLWELLITDSTGNLRICRSLPSNK
jgi:hypothetical protein